MTLPFKQSIEYDIVGLAEFASSFYLCSDLADWLGVEEVGLFNFKPSVRPVPLEVHIQASAYKVMDYSFACL